ncbi:LPS export ABC transporter permease LptF [Novispirillum sp. DQ9]|uniref:LPS export ABC transporter permease LptF n=1 Tax=Novispirillum sp. DQ9 TaxID=3398612 RepID=UPI003C7C7326
MNRYVFRQLLTGTVLVTAGLLCILWLTQSLRFVELIITRGLSVGTFLELTGLLLPNFLVIILPVALFAVVLFTYNKLNLDRELVVLRAAGVGPFGLARPALALAAVLAVAGYLMVNLWVPDTVRAFREMQWSVRNDLSRLLIQEGAFTTVMPGVTVYVRDREPSGELVGLMVHDTRDPAESATLMAERGALVQGATGPRVMMVNGSRHSVEKGTGRLSLLYFDSYTMSLGEDKEAAAIRFRDARERTMEDLLRTTADMDPNLQPVDIRRFRVEAHQRLINPLSHVTFTLIALAALLTGPFDRRGGSKRVLWAIGAMLATEAAMIGAANLATGSLAFLPLIHAAVLLPLAGAVLILARAGLVRPRRRAPLPGGVS